jgi:hypothetical protein
MLIAVRMPVIVAMVVGHHRAAIGFPLGATAYVE